MEKEFKYVVATRCMTYNHALYIEESLNGFAMQETSFPVVYLIVDDASTDGEPEVINRWIKKMLTKEEGAVLWEEKPYGKQYVAINRSKQNQTFVFLLLSENHYQNGRSLLKDQYIAEWVENSKYIAYCEGDDYWIDSLKLKKQIDYLEANTNCMLCGSNGLILWDEGVMPPKYFNNIYISRVLVEKDIIGKWALPTPSLVFRRKVRQDWPDWTKEIYSGDQTIILMALYRGTVFCLKDLTCVYRKNKSNITSLSNLLKKKPLSFQTEQHLKLYKAFDEYTNHAYQPLIGEVIHKLEKKKKEQDMRTSFYELFRRSKILALIRYPIVFFRLTKEKYIN